MTHPNSRQLRGPDDVRQAKTAILNVAVLERRIDHERIARRAYELYESRGRADGHADDDWFQSTAEYRERGPR